MPTDSEKEKQFKTFLAKNPDEPMIHFSLASIYLRGKRIDEAIAAFEKTTQLKPDYMAAFHQLAAAYEKNNEMDKAKAAYEKTLLLAQQSRDRTMIAEVQSILDNWEN